MRRVLSNMFGTPTGYRYKDGSPVLVGDRIEVEGLDKIATVHVRMNDSRLYFYLTYFADNHVHTRPLSRIMGGEFHKDTTPTWTNGKPKTRPRFTPPKYDTDMEKLRHKPNLDSKGDYILCIEEYDIAVYGTVLLGGPIDNDLGEHDGTKEGLLIQET